MGGYNAGEVASGMATAFIKSELGRWLSEAGPQAPPTPTCAARWTSASTTPTAAIFNAANSNPQYAGMGTTLVVGVFRDAPRCCSATSAIRAATACAAAASTQITHDHSLLQEQIDAGLITRRAGRVLGEQEPGDARASASRTPCCSKRTCTT